MQAWTNESAFKEFPDPPNYNREEFFMCYLFSKTNANKCKHEQTRTDIREGQAYVQMDLSYKAGFMAFRVFSGPSRPFGCVRAVNAMWMQQTERYQSLAPPRALTTFPKVGMH